MPRPGLSKRQRRRRWEDVYWTNVHLNAIKARQRAWRRYENALDAVFNDYEGIVEAEWQLLRSSAFTSSTSNIEGGLLGFVKIRSSPPLCVCVSLSLSPSTSNPRLRSSLISVL